MLAHAPTALFVPALVVAAALDPSPAIAEGAPCVKSCKRNTQACIQEECAGLHGKEKRACKETCRGAHGCTSPPIGTLAYVVTECRRLADGRYTARQSLRIRRGNCDPVMISYCLEGENAGGLCVRDADCGGGVCGDFLEPFEDAFLSGACFFYGSYRIGHGSQVAGIFRRLGVSPDGSTVLFEVAPSDHPAYATLTGAAAIAAQRGTFGIYRVRADGGEPKKIAEPATAGAWDLFTQAESRFPVGFAAGYRGFSFSPDGKTAVLTDLGPSEEGEDALAFQVVTLDVESGRKKFLTKLPPAPSQFRGIEGRPRPGSTPRFISDKRIVFLTLARTDGGAPDLEDPTILEVRTDGPVCTLRTDPTDRTGCKRIPTPDLPSGGRLASFSSFIILGGSRNILTVHTGDPVGPDPIFDTRVAEVFFNTGDNLLQLTKFGRPDTDAQTMAPNGRRAFFAASVNLDGRNPTESCQLFSADIISGRIRQLTRFRFQGGPRSETRCFPGFKDMGCHIDATLQDPASGVLVFSSSCDPFGTNPNGEQIFAIRTDGSGLRQLTHVRGLVVHADESFEVELPGPFVYSTPVQVDIL